MAGGGRDEGGVHEQGGRGRRGWWVTYAGDDQEATEALELCRSIRAFCSSKHEICVLVDLGGVSKETRGRLAGAFDYVIELGQDDFEAYGVARPGLGGGVKLCLAAWRVCPVKTVVLLPPRALVLSGDCEEQLFHAMGELELCAVPARGGGKMDGLKTSVLVLRPNNDTFLELRAALQELQVDGASDEVVLSSVLENVFQNRWTPLAPEFDGQLKLDKNGEEEDANWQRPAIINTNDEKIRIGILRDLSCMITEHTSEPIAVVGLSCRFPDANNEDEFWEVLVEGQDASRPVPAARYFTRPRSAMANNSGVDNEKAAVWSQRPAGYLKARIDEFDAKFFQTSRREAEHMDPQQRLLLEVTWEALEKAGINPQCLVNSNGTVQVGIWAQEYSKLVEAEIENGPAGAAGRDFHFGYLGNAFCAASARISHFLGLRGPSRTAESGCASALEAIHYACDALRSRTSDIALAGGANVVLNSGPGLTGFDSFILSKDGKCKTFDKGADGFGRGEAVVMLVLKRLADAQRERHEILGLLAGSAVNNDGQGSSFGTPNAVAQELVIREAQKVAGVSPHEVSYVEAHGTGTPVGDPLEFQALNAVFGHDQLRRQPLLVGSVKTNIGHTEGCSGAAGLVKVLLAMRHRTIPRHLHLVELNPEIQLDIIPASIPMDNVGWTPPPKGVGAGARLVAGVNSFGFTGTNVHMIIREPPPPLSKTVDHVGETEDQQRKMHVMVLSAASENALRDLASRYADIFAGQNPHWTFRDWARTVNTSRAHLQYRLAVIAEDSAVAAARLRKGQYITGKVDHLSSSGAASRKVAFLFTGQGYQYVSMAKELRDTHPAFRRAFNRCSALLANNYTLDLCSLIDDPTHLARHSQVALFCIEICLVRLWQSFGVVPDYVLGHSVGEFAAAVTAGFLSLEDALKLVVERNDLVNRLAEPGAMLVVKTTTTGAGGASGRGQIEALIAEFDKGHADAYGGIDIAALNSNEESVVSGTPDAIGAFETFCRYKTGVSTQRLSAVHGFHSRLMDPVLEEYASVARASSGKVKVKEEGHRQRKPVFISATLAKQLAGAADLTPDYWVAHLRQPVNYADAFRTLLAQEGSTPGGNGCRFTFVEIGPQPVLLGLGMAIDGLEGAVAGGVSHLWTPSIRRSESNWTTMLSSLGKIHCAGAVEIDWRGLDANRPGRCGVPASALPTYPFQRERYWYAAANEACGEKESLRVNSGLLHPLLGRRVPSPQFGHASYYNSLRLPTLPYLADHVVADTVILPAAGYLEMMLAAGCDTIGGTFNRDPGSVTLSIEGLVVEAACLLNGEQGGPTQLQTTVRSTNDQDDGLKYLVTIHKQVGFDDSCGSDAGNWRRLCSAVFVPCAAVTTEPTVTRSLDIASVQSELSLRTESEVDDIYNKLGATGITFGPQFKSIKRIWMSADNSEDKSTMILTETDLPAGRTNVVHPILLDTMIQTAALTSMMASTSKNVTDLTLPVGIGKFVSSPRGAWTPKLYVLTNSDGDLSRVCVSLYNERGEFLAFMEDVQLAKTTPETLRASLRSDTELMPTFYEETWVTSPGGLSPRERRVDVTSGSRGPRDSWLGPAALDELAQIQLLCAANHDMVVKSKELPYLYILKCFRALGCWPDALDESLSVLDFAKDAGVLAQHTQLLRRFFQILAEEGDVEFVDSDGGGGGGGGDYIKILRRLPEPDVLEQLIADTVSAITGDARSVDCQFTINFGERLPELLRGTLSTLALLFPERQDGVGAEAFYRSSIVVPTAHRMAFATILPVFVESLGVSAVAGATGGDGATAAAPVLRVLEVGAGTGGATEIVLAQLECLSVPYEYTFTDISPLFLKLAAEKFGGPNIKNGRLLFRLLDIESDPKRQGYTPHSYDLIVADMVLHATRHLSESVAHVRHLLVPGGVLILMEVVSRFRMLDISFGFLDGWWRFQDTHLRPDYPCIESVEWAALLKLHGFNQTETHDDPFGALGCIAAVADRQTATALTRVGRPTTAVWLILGDASGGPDHLLTSSLRRQLEAVGEKTLLVTQRGAESEKDEQSQPQRLGEDHWGVRVNSGSDFDHLLKILQSKELTLAGVVHLWSLIKPPHNDMTTMLSETCGGLLHLAQALAANCPPPVAPNPVHVFVVTSGMTLTPALDTSSADNPIHAILPGIASALNNEVAPHKFVSLDIPPSAGGAAPFLNDEGTARDIFHQLWLSSAGGVHESEMSIAIRNESRVVRRLILRPCTSKPLSLPSTERWRVQNPGTGSIEGITVVPAPKLDLGAGDVEVAVRAASLNFKDVIVALSTKDAATRLLEAGGSPNSAADGSPPPAPTRGYDFVTELGLDFAGVVTRVGAGGEGAANHLRVGDPVYGMVSGELGGSLASHVVVPGSHVALMCHGSSFEAAAALPAVLFTVHYFLVQQAQLGRGDRILIHCASGGVGLLAVQVAQYVGATVFATAGSSRKRNYLRNSMNVEHVYNSRDTQFERQIMADTDGGGVSVLLNALTGPGFKEASLSLCAPQARFLEMSKLNIWSAEEVRQRRPDVKYVVQDLSGLRTDTDTGVSPGNAFVNSFGDRTTIFQFGEQMRAAGALRDPPLTRLPLSRIHDALRYLQHAQHIGKVVVTMPATRFNEGRVLHKENLFHDCGSYLITGGLGGIGLEVASWMGRSGAKYIVLVGRSPPSTNAEVYIHQLRSDGVNVHVVQADVAEYSQCVQLLNEIEESGFPPLSGIMHSAGVLANAEISKQTPDSFMTVFRPKVMGALNLHNLTLERRITLDHFVLFGSAVGTTGGIGQANHAAANRYLDAFAGWRAGQGLPASNIAWGPWSGVGVAASLVSSMERIFGIKSISPAQGLAALERVILEQRVQSVVADISDWKVVNRSMRQGALWDLVKRDVPTIGSGSAAAAWYERKAKEINEARAGDDRLDLIKEFLDYAVRDTLRLSETEPLDHDGDLRALGIDSLMAMEIRAKLNNLFKDGAKTFSVQAFMETRTISKVAELVASVFDPDGDGELRRHTLTHDQLLELVQQDSILPQDIVKPDGGLPPVCPSYFKHVLLTGVTGQLGVFLLHELTTRRPHVFVHCLIRASSPQAAQERLKSSLTEVGLLESVNLGQVTCIAGSVSEDSFGLSFEEYAELARIVDGVIHSAALCNHVLPYGPFGAQDLRSSNVVGLLNVLRFVVAEGKSKWLQYESSLGAAPVEGASDETYLEAFPPADYWGDHLFAHGYFLSKFVCEKLLKVALEERGLAITVVRHNLLTANSMTGITAATASRPNHALMVALASVRVGAVPDLGIALSMVPVDIAARVSVQLFLNKSTPPGIYTVNNPGVVTMPELLRLLEAQGYPMRLLPFPEWRAAVLGSERTELAPLADWYVDDMLSSNFFTKSVVFERLRDGGGGGGSDTTPVAGLQNSDRLKKLVPDVDDVMPHPAEMIALELEALGKDTLLEIMKQAEKKE